MLNNNGNNPTSRPTTNNNNNQGPATPASASPNPILPPRRNTSRTGDTASNTATSATSGTAIPPAPARSSSRSSSRNRNFNVTNNINYNPPQENGSITFHNNLKTILEKGNVVLSESASTENINIIDEISEFIRGDKNTGIIGVYNNIPDLTNLNALSPLLIIQKIGNNNIEFDNKNLLNYYKPLFGINDKDVYKDNLNENNIKQFLYIINLNYIGLDSVNNNNSTVINIEPTDTVVSSDDIENEQNILEIHNKTYKINDKYYSNLKSDNIVNYLKFIIGSSTNSSYKGSIVSQNMGNVKTLMVYLNMKGTSTPTPDELSNLKQSFSNRTGLNVNQVEAILVQGGGWVGGTESGSMQNFKVKLVAKDVKDDNIENVENQMAINNLENIVNELKNNKENLFNFTLNSASNVDKVDSDIIIAANMALPDWQNNDNNPTVSNSGDNGNGTGNGTESDQDSDSDSLSELESASEVSELEEQDDEQAGQDGQKPQDGKPAEQERVGVGNGNPNPGSNNPSSGEGEIARQDEQNQQYRELAVLEDAVQEDAVQEDDVQEDKEGDEQGEGEVRVFNGDNGNGTGNESNSNDNSTKMGLTVMKALEERDKKKSTENQENQENQGPSGAGYYNYNDNFNDKEFNGGQYLEQYNYPIKNNKQSLYNFIIPLMIFKIYRILLYKNLLKNEEKCAFQNIFIDFISSFILIIVLFILGLNNVASVLFTDLLLSIVIIYLFLFTYDEYIKNKNKLDVEYIINILILIPYFVMYL